jgi:3-polyprenyl-4-hydroxybenzoate decarboxylase
MHDGPGQGMKAGHAVADRNPIAKVVIPATEIIKDLQGIVTGPSQPVQRRTSKIIIDATMQWPHRSEKSATPAAGSTYALARPTSRAPTSSALSTVGA